LLLAANICNFIIPTCLQKCVVYMITSFKHQ